MTPQWWLICKINIYINFLMYCLKLRLINFVTIMFRHPTIPFMGGIWRIFISATIPVGYMFVTMSKSFPICKRLSKILQLSILIFSFGIRKAPHSIFSTLGSYLKKMCTFTFEPFSGGYNREGPLQLKVKVSFIVDQRQLKIMKNTAEAFEVH